MTCQECIAQASDFIDDTLSPLERARQAEHVQRCSECARYHRVLHRGLELVHDLPEIEPSPGFRGRLHRRLHGLGDVRIRRERAVLSGATVVIAVAGMIALAAWAPVWQEAMQARQDTAIRIGDRLPGLPPADMPTGDWWYEVPVTATPTRAVQRVATFPGPYSPLVVQPPVVSGIRASAPLYGDSE